MQSDLQRNFEIRAARLLDGDLYMICRTALIEQLSCPARTHLHIKIYATPLARFAGKHGALAVLSVVQNWNMPSQS